MNVSTVTPAMTSYIANETTTNGSTNSSEGSLNCYENGWAEGCIGVYPTAEVRINCIKQLILKQ